jgi:hypothetical protein
MLYRSLGRSPLSSAEASATARGVGRPCLIQVLFNSLPRSNGFSKKRYVPPKWLTQQAAFPGLDESSDKQKPTITGGFSGGIVGFPNVLANCPPKLASSTNFHSPKRTLTAPFQIPSHFLGHQPLLPAHCHLATST